MCSNALHCDFIAHIVVKSWNHSFSKCKTNNSWWACPRFGTEAMAIVASAAPLKRLHCRCYAKDAESSSSSSSSEYNVTVTHNVWITLCDGWRVGIVQPRCNRIRDGRLVTLPYLTLPYLTLPYLTLPYLTLPYPVSYTHLTLPTILRV